MDALEATSIPECTLCALIDVEDAREGSLSWWDSPPSWWNASYEPVNSTRKHEMLHGACHRCDDPNVPDLARCCDWCQHLRLKHFLLCSNPGELEKRITIRWSRSATTPCEFCDFLARDGDEVTNVQLLLLHLPDLPAWRAVHQLEGRHVPLFAITPERDHLCVSRYIDWTWVEDWIEDLHKDQPQYPAERWVNTFDFDFPSKSCSNVRVVDVIKKCVVPLPPGDEYIALSYVWGVNQSSNQFQLSTSNVQFLERPGSLQDIILPATISDAMLACNKLGLSYLWVDRLCIIQDGSWDHKSLQLDQMAIIYGQALLTIVAAEGDNAEHGLVGVSRPRCSPVAFKFNESVGLVEQIPSLSDALEKTEWAKRGWTYQEYIASDKLLFFTKHGLFFSWRQGIDVVVFPEGPVAPRFWASSPITTLHEVLHNYTRKVLTHPTDILHALTGILYASEGRRTTYGIPWNDFDRYILWSPVQCDRSSRRSTDSDIFPTWSWTSAYGPIDFGKSWDNVYSLAYWGVDSDEYRGTTTKSRWKPFGMDSSTFLMDAVELVALAWLNGCVRSRVPDWLNLDHSDPKATESLVKRWNDYGTYWNDVFGGYANLKVFDTIDIGKTVVEGKIAVHTQTATFILDKSKHDRGIGKSFVRTCNENNIAGAIRFDRQPTSENNAQLKIIAMSVSNRKTAGPEAMIKEHLSNMETDLSISQFYGCACCYPDRYQIGLTHLVECPKHEDFWEPVPLPQDEGSTRSSTPEDWSTAPGQAFAKHLWEAKHLNGYDDLTGRMRDPPKVNVMVVARSSVQSGSTIVYERLGIGAIYLKKWLEASPKFETLVLA